MSDQYDHLSRQTFTLLVILTGSGTFSGPHFHTLHFKRTSIFFQVFTSMSLLVRLACSNYYGVIFKILTGQKRDVSQLKFLWPVNTTGNGPYIYIYFFVFICFIIASYFHPFSLVFSSLLKMKVLFWNFSPNIIIGKFQGQKNGFHELHIERSWNII